MNKKQNSTDAVAKEVALQRLIKHTQQRHSYTVTSCGCVVLTSSLRTA